MNRINAQFAVVFVGVLLLHLAAATALRRSAGTDETPGKVTSLDPYYHSGPDHSDLPRDPNPNPNPAVPTPEKAGEREEIAVRPAEILPATAASAFANAKPASDSHRAKPVEQPPALKRIDPAAESASRRLTLTQLLAPEPTPDEKIPPVETGTELAAPGPERIKPLPATGTDPKVRKIRSLSGN